MSIGTPEAQYRIIDEENVIPYCFGEYEMPEETAAPAADADATVAETTSPTTGNTSAAVIVSFAAIAGIAALASKNRK